MVAAIGDEHSLRQCVVDKLVPHIDAVVNDEGGETLLHVAVAGGRKDLVLALLDLGASPHVCNKAGPTQCVLARNLKVILFERALDPSTLNLSEIILHASHAHILVCYPHGLLQLGFLCCRQASRK
jgi:ankyrin repeat protein